MLERIFRLKCAGMSPANFTTNCLKVFSNMHRKTNMIFIKFCSWEFTNAIPLSKTAALTNWIENVFKTDKYGCIRILN